MQTEHVQPVPTSLLGCKEIVPSSIECRPRSRDLTTPYIQYVKRTMPTIISIKLNVAERNVNRIAPNTSIAIAMTRILPLMHWNSCHGHLAVVIVSSSSSEIVIAVGINIVTVQIHQASLNFRQVPIVPSAPSNPGQFFLPILGE